MERVAPLSHQPARPSEVTPLTSFYSWEARCHLGEGGPSVLVLLGCWDPRVGASHCLSTSPVCWKKRVQHAELSPHHGSLITPFGMRRAGVGWGCFWMLRVLLALTPPQWAVAGLAPSGVGLASGFSIPS